MDPSLWKTEVVGRRVAAGLCLIGLASGGCVLLGDGAVDTGAETSESGDGDGDGDGGEDGGDGDGDGDGDELPPGPHCYEAGGLMWLDEWREFEAETVALINEARAAGADCGTAGIFEPTGPLTAEPHLRCASRLHSKDMSVRDFFSHINPDGIGPGPRITEAGYSWSAWSENIACGAATPESVVQGWLNSDGHCGNLMNPAFQDTGLGFYEGDGSCSGVYWTQTFGTSPP